MAVYSIQIPPHVKEGLPLAAARHGMKTPDLVRIVLTLLATNEISLDLSRTIVVRKGAHHDRPTPAAD